MKRSPIDPELLRDRLAETQGKRYWQSLEELADDPQFREAVTREFPSGASVWDDPVSRRRFFQLMSASLALAGLAGAGCRPPAGVIMPYVRQPENLVPGKPLFFATAMPLGGFATGLLVESHEGRPTKIEGNPLHPASLGATTPQQQSAILDLYDPDRSQTVQFRQQPRALGDVLGELRRRLGTAERPTRGEKFAILSQVIGSPTLLAQKDEFLSAYPEARWFSYELIHRDNATAGARLALGAPYHSYHHLDRADVVVAFDSDFLTQGPGCLIDTRNFAARRREGGGKAGMNRLYVFESDLSVTGARADHRLPVKPTQIDTLVRGLATRLGLVVAASGQESAEEKRWLDILVADLKGRAPGTTLILTGDGQPPVVHALVHAINHRLGNFGKTIEFTEPLPGSPSGSMASLDALVSAIAANEIETLLILGGNPVYTAPADLQLGSRLADELRKRPLEKWLAVHVGTHFDETSRLCHWHIPQTHFLEEWSDGIAFDGTASIVQPLIAPLYSSKSLHEVLAALTPSRFESGNYDTRASDEIIRAYWKTNRPPGEDSFERYWRKSLHDGVLAGTRQPTLVPAVIDFVATPPVKPATEDFELRFSPDPALYDGRFANNGWLQEWPRPLTRLSWDNALLVGPETAQKLGVNMKPAQRKGGEHGDMVVDVVALRQGRMDLRDVPVFIVPGHAEGVGTLHMGSGRTRAGKVGTKVGVNANLVRTSRQPWFVDGVKIAHVTGRSHSLACQQGHWSMEGRPIVLSGTVAENADAASAFRTTLAQARHEVEGKRKPLPTLLPGHEYPGYKWGMAIDLSTCTGCGACVVACQSENNIPVVGKEQVLRGREMHWLRVDRYFETRLEDTTPNLQSVHFQPLPCQHCENAPCELVCPVEATVHGDEGTNDMVYNRCVGTRYCANNCPYKVRRFNFLDYSDFDTPSLKLMYNPEVTVRSRGVMEKCTFCIQRISHVRIEASKEALEEREAGLPAEKRRRLDPHERDVPYIHDGEVRTACQAACPAEAIIFGDLNDPSSRVRKMHDDALRYDLLGELGTQPRVAYLAGLRNPNPKLVEK